MNILGIAVACVFLGIVTAGKLNKRSFDTRVSGNCFTQEYKCSNGKCIADAWVCDGHKDCDNNEDEQNCPLQKRNEDREWTISEKYDYMMRRGIYGRNEAGFDRSETHSEANRRSSLRSKNEENINQLLEELKRLVQK